MKAEDTIVNRVEKSGLLTIDLQDYLTDIQTRVIDLKDYLFQGLVLKEKDFRRALKELDGTQFKEVAVLITCTADAIIPAWAFMLIALELESYAKKVSVGDLEQLESLIYQNLIK